MHLYGVHLTLDTPLLHVHAHANETVGVGMSRPPAPSDPIAAAYEAETAARFLADPLAAFGPFIMGAVLDAVCLGVVIVQGQTWWVLFRKGERRLVRLLVYWLCIAAVATTIFIIVFIHRLFIQNYGYYVQFNDRTWSSTIFVLHAISRIPAGLFFADRAWRMLDRSVIFASVVGGLSFASFAGSILSKVYYTQPVTPLSQAVAGYGVIVWLAGEVLSDIIITGVIIVQLYRSRTGWSGTDALIHKLLLLLAETQLPPTIVASAFMLTFFILPRTTIPFIFMVAPKVHVICLLAVLNRKASLKRDLQSSQDYVPSGQRSKNGVAIQTETHIHVEREDGGTASSAPRLESSQRARQVAFTNRLPVSTDDAEDGRPSKTGSRGVYGGYADEGFGEESHPNVAGRTSGGRAASPWGDLGVEVGEESPFASSAAPSTAPSLRG